MSDQQTTPPAAWTDWGIKGIGGVLRIVEEGCRAGGKLEGESLELAKSYHVRLGMLLLGEHVPANVRTPDELHRWLAERNQEG